MHKILIWILALWVTTWFYWVKFYFFNQNISNSYDFAYEIEKDTLNEFKQVENEIDIIDNILYSALEKEYTIYVQQKNKHINPPEDVKALYFSAHSINNAKKFNNFLDIAKQKEINSILIDIKEVDWYTNFPLDESFFTTIYPVTNNRIKNIESIIEKLHENNIYVIARIAVFKDKRLAEARLDLAVKNINTWKAWEDYKWYKYTDQYSQEVWDYHANLWIAAYNLWFDEINYDYVRFPTDWYISQTSYSFAWDIIEKNPKWGKVMVIDEFAHYITSKVREYNSDIKLSADIFWLVTDNTMFNIGQNLESFLLSFDYVWPMVYPSHYWEGYYWFKYPDNNPYWVIKTALWNAKEKVISLNQEIKNAWIEYRDIRLNDNFIFSKQDSIWEISVSQIRPFLQWFSCGRCRGSTPYNREKFRWQVDAAYELWIDSWWVRSSGSNYYTNRYNGKQITKKDEN